MMSELIYSLAASEKIAFAARSSGLMRSLDQGLHWQDAFASLNLPSAISATAVAISPPSANDPMIFAAVPGGILRSFDEGNSWELSLLPTPEPFITALAISPDFSQNQTLFAASLEDGVFCSTDAGARWISWNFGLLDFQAFGLQVTPANILYVGTGTGLFASHNQGRAWKEIPLPCGHVPILSLTSTSHLLLAGTEGNGLFASPDQGRTWQIMPGTDQETFNTLVSDGDAILALTSDALQLSRDLGQTWQVLPGASNQVPVAVCAPFGLAEGSLILVGYDSGEVAVQSL